MALPDPWPEFSLDPRRPEHAAVRAADTDRNVVLGVLTEAYAQGRLDRDEHEERSSRAHEVRTLGEVLPLIDDLVSPGSAGLVPVSGATPTHVEAQAVARWERQRREALLGFLVPTLITWVIWAVVMFGEFPWPAIVTVATAIPLIEVLVSRKDLIASHERRILKREEKQARKQLPAPGSDDSDPGTVDSNG